MSNEHDDDEIRESIPCSEDGWPAGYCRTQLGLCWRGVLVRDNSGMPDYDRAWSDAIAREKARRARNGELPPPRKAVPIPPGEDTAQYLIRERDKAAAMLAEVIRERDAMRAKLEKVREIADKQDLIYAHDIAAIIGKDGEA